MYIALDFPSMQREEVFWNQTPPETGLTPPSTLKRKPRNKKLPCKNKNKIDGSYRVRGGLKLEKQSADCCSWWDENKKLYDEKQVPTPAKTEMTKSKVVMISSYLIG